MIQAGGCLAGGSSAERGWKVRQRAPPGKQVRGVPHYMDRSTATSFRGVIIPSYSTLIRADSLEKGWLGWTCTFFLGCYFLIKHLAEIRNGLNLV